MMANNKSKEQQDATAALVDEYGQLEKELAPLKPKLNRLERLAKSFRQLAEEADAAIPVVFAGRDYEITLSARGPRTMVAPMAAVYKKLGKDLFLQVAGVTISALEAHVHPEIVASLTHEEQTGPRKIDVRAKNAAAA